MTEEEAKTKWCPMARIQDGSVVINTVNLDERVGGGRANVCCIASACMMWRVSQDGRDLSKWDISDTLMTRASNCLKALGIVTAEQLVKMDVKSLLIQGVGITTVMEIVSYRDEIKAVRPNGGYCGLAGRPMTEDQLNERERKSHQLSHLRALIGGIGDSPTPPPPPTDAGGIVSRGR